MTVPSRRRSGPPDVVDYATAALGVFLLIATLFLVAVLLAVLLGG